MIMYNLKVTEKELIRILYIMGLANGASSEETAYHQAYEHLVVGRGFEKAFRSNRSAFIRHLLVPIIDYYHVRKEWEEFIENKGEPSPIKHKIDLLEKELAELRKLV